MLYFIHEILSRREKRKISYVNAYYTQSNSFRDTISTHETIFLENSSSIAVQTGCIKIHCFPNETDRRTGDGGLYGAINRRRGKRDVAFLLSRNETLATHEAKCFASGGRGIVLRRVPTRIRFRRDLRYSAAPGLWKRISQVWRL